MSTKDQADPKNPKASDPMHAPDAPADGHAPAHVDKHVDGPKSKEAMHATESKVPHPQGKVRHGGRDA